MNTFFYLSHTLYAKVLIPLIVRLTEAGQDIHISKNKFDFLRYSPYRYASTPISNTFVNQSSFDYVARISGYPNEWDAAKKKVKFTFFSPKECDTIIGTTKDLSALKSLQKRNSGKNIFAVGYQHMPFVLSLKGDLKHRNLPDVCMDIFTKPNPFSNTHKFPEYISDYKLSFRDFSYLEKVYSDYFLKKSDIPKRHVLIFHPGGYRGVITKIGEGKKASYQKQREFLDTICRPILEKGLIPVIKMHPLTARYHFKKDVLKILELLSKERKDFLKVIVEEDSYYKYVYGSDTMVTFGSSGIYELFSMGAKNLIICNFFGKSRSNKFSFMKGIFIDTVQDYNNFWNKRRDNYFLNAYKENPILNKIYKSYFTLFSENTSDQILEDIGLV